MEAKVGLFKFIKKKWDDWYYHDLDDGDTDWDDDFIDQIDVHKNNDEYFADADQRSVYVLECLDRMAEASDKMDQLDAEYQAVTSLLLDMEEIESLPKNVKNKIEDEAKSIEKLELEKKKLYKDAIYMPEEEIRLIERLNDEIPEGIKKMQEAEEYRRLVNHDMKKLEGERKAFKYRRTELNQAIVNSRGIAVITAIALVLCIVLLLVLQYYYEMDVRIGYIVAGSVGAITLTALYIKYVESIKETERLSKSFNKLISIHNTVKIRYINNTNLLQYLYMKYEVNDSSELQEMWDDYQKETATRLRDERINEDLEYHYDKMIRILAENNIQDPEIWTRQVNALYDSREMVEVRHALIARRQKLREQMEYNKKIATDAKDSIELLARKYPKYSAEISEIVSRYKGA